MNPRQLKKWVTIHHSLDHYDSGPPRKGFKLDQTIALHGVHFHVHWTLSNVDSPNSATWTGTGRAGSHGTIHYRLNETVDGGTIFEYDSFFKPPGGLLGKLAEKFVIHEMPQHEAGKSLKRLKELLEGKIDPK